ncbi:MAG: hypothetical protein EA352_05835 [Gemmatimonadales bacterium]|nr:MAG: hypothetical protein EA352_05835 [Gemmatimonadales bacterium]
MEAGPHPAHHLLLPGFQMLALLLALGLGAAPAPPGAPPILVPEAALPDTFLDPGARELHARAREARGLLEEGLDAWDATMWERVRVGLDGELFRRGRGLFFQERVARIGWREDGERLVRWEGARQEVPVAGWSAADDLDDLDDPEAGGWLGRRLLSETPAPLRYDPGSDRLPLFGDNGGSALDPLADTATRHYRYRSGDTLRLQLPGADAPLTLRELRVEPRQREFRLVTASLWFEEVTGALVRAIYRPSRPFDLALDTSVRGRARLLVPPFTAEIHVVSVDYGLHELRWWLPRRFVFDGEARLGGLAAVPVEVEWELSDVVTNELADLRLDPDSLPPGWQARERMAPRPVADGEDPAPGDSVRVGVWVTPPDRELLEHGRVQGARPPGGDAFTRSEREALEAQVRELAVRAPGLGPQLSWGLGEGLTRYNRVEGLATGIQASLPLSGGRTVSARVQLGWADPIPSGRLELRSGGPARGRTFSVYSGLTSSAPQDNALGLPASISTAVLGGGPSPFHRASGISVRFDARPGATTRTRLELSLEDQRAVERNTDTHIRRLWSDGRRLPPVLPPDEGQWALVGTRTRWYSGQDPDAARGFGALSGRGGAGSSQWGQAELRLGSTLPLGTEGRFGVAAEVVAAGSVGSLPFQARLFPGGPDDFRGLRIGERSGEHMGLARLELGWGRPGARVAVFGDALRLGGQGADFRLRRASTHEGPDPGWTLEPGATRTLGAVGLGASVLDGWVRTDLVRALADGGSWRFLVYFDGLF